MSSTDRTRSATSTAGAPPGPLVSFLRATLLPFLVLRAALVERSAAPMGLFRDNRAYINLGRPLAIVGMVIGGIVVVLLLAALAGQFFSAIADINGELTTADTNSTVGNAILAVFPVVVAVAAIVGFVGLVITAVQFTKNR